MTEHPGAVEGLRVERRGGVVELVLDRPSRRNALDDTMVAGLIEAVDAAGRDESARIVLLRGEGDHFCAGADLVARNTPDGRRPRVGSIQRRLPSQANRLVALLCQVQTPVVVRAHGWCAGLGLNLALAADVCVAAADARFWAPFSERGFTPDSGATWLLPRRIGEVRARRMLLLGQVVSGEEAAAWQMVHDAVPLERLDEAVGEVVEALGSGPTVALGLTKWLLHSAWSQPIEQHLRDEAFALELSSRSEDFREGLAAFTEKRSPGFTGR